MNTEVYGIIWAMLLSGVVVMWCVVETVKKIQCTEGARFMLAHMQQTFQAHLGHDLTRTSPHLFMHNRTLFAAACL